MVILVWLSTLISVFVFVYFLIIILPLHTPHFQKLTSLLSVSLCLCFIWLCVSLELLLLLLFMRYLKLRWTFGASEIDLNTPHSFVLLQTFLRRHFWCCLSFMLPYSSLLRGSFVLCSVRCLVMLARSILTLHYENMPIQIYRKFHLQKLKIFR